MEKFLFKARKPALIDLKGSNSTWVELDMVGKWDGYVRNGEPETIETTPEMLSEIIDNFNKEVNSKPVYLSHADLYQDEPEAIGWIRELKFENERLHGFIEFNPDVADKIRKGAWKYVSVLIMSDVVDRKTGEDSGWYLWSLAVTNQPFVDGLAPISFAKKNLNDKTKNLVYLSKKEIKKNMEIVAKELSADVAALSPEECATLLDDFAEALRSIAGADLSLDELLAVLMEHQDAFASLLSGSSDPAPADSSQMEALSVAVQALKQEIKELKEKNAAMEKNLSTYQSKEVDSILEQYDISPKSKEMWRKSASLNRALFNEQIKDLPLKNKNKVVTQEFDYSEDNSNTISKSNDNSIYNEIMAFSKFGKKK